jgi:hypothetical protein
VPAPWGAHGMTEEISQPSSLQTGPESPPVPSPSPCYTGWEPIYADALLSRGPVLFHGLVLSDAAAIVATVYDGINALGRRVCSVQTDGLVPNTVPMLLNKPILLQSGLFVALSAAPDDCLVLFDPLPNA